MIAELESLIGRHPLRERFRGQLMLALYRSGRQAEALEAYQATRTALVDELGIEPGRELRALNQAILVQDQSLELVREARPDPLGHRPGCSWAASASSPRSSPRSTTRWRVAAGSCSSPGSPASARAG